LKHLKKVDLPYRLLKTRLKNLIKQEFWEKELEKVKKMHPLLFRLLDSPRNLERKLSGS